MQKRITEALKVLKEEINKKRKISVAEARAINGDLDWFIGKAIQRGFIEDGGYFEMGPNLIEVYYPESIYYWDKDYNDFVVFSKKILLKTFGLYKISDKERVREMCYKLAAPIFHKVKETHKNEHYRLMHDIPFKELVNMWLTKIDGWATPEVVTNEVNGVTNLVGFRDTRLAQSWVDFYSKIATYKWLPKK